MLIFTQEAGFGEAADPGAGAFGDAHPERVGALRIRLSRAAEGATHGYVALVPMDDARDVLVADEGDLVALAQVIATLATGSLAEQVGRLLPAYLSAGTSGTSWALIAKMLAAELEGDPS